MAKSRTPAGPVLPPGPACEACGGQECRTPRIVVCCEACTHA
jgi:hypothetical protein